jgi:hypothetical protein
VAKYIYHEAIVRNLCASSTDVLSVPFFKIYFLFIASKGVALIASSFQDIQQNRLPEFSKFNQRGGNNA